MAVVTRAMEEKNTKELTVMEMGATLYTTIREGFTDSDI